MLFHINYKTKYLLTNKNNYTISHDEITKLIEKLNNIN